MTWLDERRIAMVRETVEQVDIAVEMVGHLIALGAGDAITLSSAQRMLRDAAESLASMRFDDGR